MGDGVVDYIFDKVDIEDLFFLEIVFFVFLGIFCVCVLVFIINCVMLVLKVKFID